MEQILYGVGKTILKSLEDGSVIGLSKLKDVTVSMTGEEEPVEGGDSMFPITYFPTDKAINVSAQNALFDISMLQVSQGGNISTGVVTMFEPLDFIIPSDGIVQLEHSPVADSVKINGFTEVGASPPSTGEFYVDTINDTIEFAVADAGKHVVGIYEWQSSSNAETIEILENTIVKPFMFIHRIPIYDDESNVVAEGQLVIYKAKSNNNFELNLQPKTAFAPTLELNALDPKRADKKLWDFTIDPVA